MKSNTNSTHDSSIFPQTAKSFTELKVNPLEVKLQLITLSHNLTVRSWAAMIHLSLNSVFFERPFY